MLDLFLKIALGAAALIVGAIVISGIITKQKIKAELQRRRIRGALVDAIDNCDNVVKLEDIDSGNEIKLKGDGVSRDVRVGETIYAY